MAVKDSLAGYAAERAGGDKVFDLVQLYEVFAALQAAGGAWRGKNSRLLRLPKRMMRTVDKLLGMRAAGVPIDLVESKLIRRHVASMGWSLKLSRSLRPSSIRKEYCHWPCCLASLKNAVIAAGRAYTWVPGRQGTMRTFSARSSAGHL